MVCLAWLVLNLPILIYVMKPYKVFNKVQIYSCRSKVRHVLAWFKFSDVVLSCLTELTCSDLSWLVLPFKISCGAKCNNQDHYTGIRNIQFLTVSGTRNCIIINTKFHFLLQKYQFWTIQRIVSTGFCFIHYQLMIILTEQILPTPNIFNVQQTYLDKYAAWNHINLFIEG